MKADINFSTNTVSVGEYSVLFVKVEVPVHEVHAEQEEAERVLNKGKELLEAKYEPADLDEVVAEATALNPDQKKGLRALLEKYKDLFDGTLGEWKGDPYHIDLKPGAKPVCTKAFPVPVSRLELVKKEVEHLCKIGVLQKVTGSSAWGFPAFAVPKKNQTIRFVADLRKLNDITQRKPYPIPRILDIMQQFQGFTFATSLDLNMGFWHIPLDEVSSEMCTIVMPWGK